MNHFKKGKDIELNKKKYRLVEQIGQGGSGIVWKIKYKSENLAVKFLKKEVESEKRKRFLKEIEFCKNNTHRNIIKVISRGSINIIYGKDEEETLTDYYIMPYYEKNLKDIIKNESEYKKIFSYILKICEGIEFIHHQGVIHRDLKPENILINNEELVIADLGIAHFKEFGLTRKNDLLANRNYASPEQRKKNMAKKITTAADIFSLGCIINEIFTGENPLGSKYIRVEDIYPELVGMDEIIDRCMRQNPLERPDIKQVFLEIDLFKNDYENKIDNISYNLYEAIEAIDIEKTTFEEENIKKIINTASKDILAAKYLFENKTLEEMKRYNHNYNCQVHYKIDDFLERDLFDKLIFKECKKKFIYESNTYKNNYFYTPLNLKNPDDKVIYDGFKNIMLQYGYNNGLSLKLFSSCEDYHCLEIIESINSIKKEITDLEDAPILYIVLKLKYFLEDIIEINNKVRLDDHIMINWEKTINSSVMNKSLVNKELFLDRNIVNEIEVLEKFRGKWNIIFKKQRDEYIVYFQSEKSYTSFKSFALNMSKPYYQFEGDVLDLIKIERAYEDIIELKPLDSFEVVNVLAKILGIRSDY